MSNQVYTRQQLVFPAIEATYGVVPASHPVNGDACLVASFNADVIAPEIVRPDKTGSFGEILGIPGRRAATWSASMAMAGGGTATTPPDSNEFLQLAFGTAPTIGGSSVTYAPSDAVPPPSASIFDFNDPSTATQFVVLGAICSKFGIDLGGDVPMFTFSGEAMWVYDTIQAADGTTDTVAKGGLVSFPTRPSAPVVHGIPPQGYSGTWTLDANAYTSLRKVSIASTIARATQKDTNSSYPVGPGVGLRSYVISWDMYDDDSANLSALKTKSLKNTNPFPVENLSFVIGTTAGNIFTMTGKNAKILAPTYDKQSERRIVKFSAKLHDTSIGSNDALTLVCT